MYRLTLTYDCTFLGLFLNSIFSDSIQINNGYCLLHPMRKRKIVRNNKFIDYAADCNIMLAYNKFLDNMLDEEKIFDKIASTALSKSYKNAKKSYPRLAMYIENKLGELHKLEKEKCNNIDKISEPFALITQKLFCNDELAALGEHSFDLNTIKALEWLGYNVGKWIYIADSCDDIRDDYVEGIFNPILCAKPMKENESIDDYKKRISRDIAFILDYCLAEAAKAIDLLNLKHGTGIIENIIYSGMRRISMEVIK